MQKQWPIKSKSKIQIHLSIKDILQIPPISLPTSLPHSFLSAMHTFSIFLPRSLCAMHFFLLCCSLWGALLLFRLSRYKGHAKYKHKYKCKKYNTSSSSPSSSSLEKTFIKKTKQCGVFE